MLAAEATHRDHAIIEQIIAELKNGPDRRPPWNSRTDRQLNNAHPTIKPTEDQLPTQQTRDGGSRLSHAVMTSRVLAELIAARYPRPDGARGRRRRLRRGTPARRGRPDHLDQPAEGHLGAARTAAAPHRSLGATTHPRRPVGHPPPMSPPSRRPRTHGTPPRSVRHGRTDAVQITELAVCGTARFAAEPYGSFWSATTSPGLEQLRDRRGRRPPYQPSSTRAARYSRVERAPGTTRDSKTAAAAMGARRATSRAISGIRSYSAPVGAIGTTTCVASARARSTMPSANGGYRSQQTSQPRGVGRPDRAATARRTATSRNVSRPPRHTALRVRVQQHHLVAELSESVGAVGRGGGLAYAALEPRAGDDDNDRRQRSRRLST